MDNPELRTVKVYQCDEVSGQWFDQGTGYLDCVYSGAHDQLTIVVRDSEKGTLLLETPVIPALDFHRQQETLIVWRDPRERGGIDMALSFLKAEGCDYAWEKICRYQGKSPLEAAASTDEIVDASSAAASATPLQLPEPSLSTLHQLFDAVANVTIAERAALINAVIKPDFIPKLLETFKLAEEVEDEESLSLIHRIVNTLAFLNDPSVQQILFSPENIMPVIGTFEYDPEMKLHAVKHREFLENRSRFKQVVPFRSAAVLEKAHHNFRLQYLKDVVFPRLIDDQTYGHVGTMISQNNMDIVSALHEDPQFAADLFAATERADTRLDALRLLQELCGIARGLPPSIRVPFFTSLFARGLMRVLEAHLGDRNFNIRLAVLDVIASLLTNDTALFREQLLTQKDAQWSMLRLMIRRFVQEPDQGLQEQLKEALRSLMEFNSQEGPLPEKDEFLQGLYDNIDELLQPITAPEPELWRYSSSLQAHALDLLCYCVQQHGFRIKYHLLRQMGTERALRLIRHRERFVQLAVVRLFRVLVSMRDDFYDKHIDKYNLLAPIVEVFLQNGARYNLLNSAVLDLFEFIRKEDRNFLIKYFGQKLLDKVKDITYTDVFSKLAVKYEQLLERERNPPSSTASAGTPSSGPAAQRQRRNADSDDEYFSRDDDVEVGPMPNLVDSAYGSDEDTGPAPPPRPRSGAAGGAGTADEPETALPTRPVSAARAGAAGTKFGPIVMRSGGTTRSLSPPLHSPSSSPTRGASPGSPGPASPAPPAPVHAGTPPHTPPVIRGLSPRRSLSPPPPPPQSASPASPQLVGPSREAEALGARVKRSSDELLRRADVAAEACSPSASSGAGVAAGSPTAESAAGSPSGPGSVSAPGTFASSAAAAAATAVGGSVDEAGSAAAVKRVKMTVADGDGTAAE